MEPSASINPARYGPIFDLNSDSELNFGSFLILKYLFIVFIKKKLP